MAFRAGARCLETTTTTGTGAITLAGAVSGYRTIASVATADGDTFYYVIAGGTEWEEGFGTRTSATTFARTTPLAGSAATPISFSAGTKEVWIDLPGRQAQGRGLYAGEINGLTLTNGTDAVNDINIAVGHASDSTNIDLMRLDTALGKQSDVAWAVGGTTGAPAGGLDTGAVGNGTYHVFLIKRPDTGVVDALFSLSATAPTMPANYTLFRRIGSIIRALGTILAFTQTGDVFRLAAFRAIRNSTALLANSLIDTLVPSGIRVRPVMTFFFDTDSTVGVLQINITDPLDSGGTNLSFILSMNQSSQGSNTFEAGIYTNTSGQIRLVVSSTGTNLDAGIISLTAWIDERNRLGIL